MDEYQHKYTNINGIRLHYVTAGKGPPVILLHGFPEFWYAWRHQISVLEKHFEVIAPDLRGYGDTEKSPNVEDYQLNHIVDDVAALIKSLGHEKAHIVGHDWGGAVAWRLALDQPNVVDRLVILNSPHPYIFAKALRSNFRQMLKSWYMFFFQLPWLPESIFNLFSKQILKRILQDSTIRTNTFSDEDLNKYHQMLIRPGAFTAALNYYRAAFRHSSKTIKQIKKIRAPTMLIWGESDSALGKDLTYGMDPLFEGPFTIEYIPQCSHWVNEEQPHTVNKLLFQHLL